MTIAPFQLLESLLKFLDLKYLLMKKNIYHIVTTPVSRSPYNQTFIKNYKINSRYFNHNIDNTPSRIY